jgi:hypothetical protein
MGKAMLSDYVDAMIGLAQPCATTITSGQSVGRRRGNRNIER